MKRIAQPLKQILPSRVYFGCCSGYEKLQMAGAFIRSQGLGRQCPFCRMHFRRFLPDAGYPSRLFGQEKVIGGGPVAEESCPYCMSFARERHAYLYLRELAAIGIGAQRLLHVAPEKRLRQALLKLPNITYIPVDLSSRFAKARMDLTALPFRSSIFDVVLCNHVLEHIPDDRNAMAELNRVMKPGGWAMLQVPIAASRSRTQEDRRVSDPAKRLELYGQEDHVRLYGLDYRQKLECNGFEVELHSVAEALGREYATRFGLLPDERLYIARKLSQGL